MTIRDSTYKVVGYIEKSGTGGKLTAKDSIFRVKGHYDPRTNRTLDSCFRMVSYGNTLAALLHPSQGCH